MKNKSLNWKEVELKDLGGLMMGQSPKGHTYNTENKGIPLLNGAADIKNTKIIPKQYTTKPTKLSKKGDILFCIRATIGKSITSDKEYCLGRGVAGFRANKNLLDARFLLKILDKKLMELIPQGSTIIGLKGTDIEKIKIPLPFRDGKPDLKEQERIVAILEKAEALKQKRDMADKLTQEYLKSVFYDMFLKNKLSEIELGEITKIVSGATPSTVKLEYWDGEINWVTPAELLDGSNYYYYETQRKITEAGLKSCSAEIFPKNTVMLTTRAPIGKVALAGREMCSNQGFKNFICEKNKLNPIYLYFWFLINKTYLQSLGRGATFGEISKSGVSKIKIPLPPIELQNKFAAIVEHVEEMKEKQLKSKEYIGEIFGSLMQKAFNGGLVQ